MYCIFVDIKVVERAGITIRDKMPGLREKDCQNEEEKCFIHNNGGTGNCRVESIVYKAVCNMCKEKGPSSKRDKDGNIRRLNERKEGTRSVYIGETSRTAFQSGLQHLYALRKPKAHRDNALCKHIIECHQGDKAKDIKFKVDIVKSFKSPFERQIWEGVEIHGCERDIIMNSKQDHYQPVVGRMIVTNAPRDD